MFVVLMARLEARMKIVTGVVILLFKYSPVRRDFSFISLCFFFRVFFNKNNTNKAKTNNCFDLGIPGFSDLSLKLKSKCQSILIFPVSIGMSFPLSRLLCYDPSHIRFDLD